MSYNYSILRPFWLTCHHLPGIWHSHEIQTWQFRRVETQLPSLHFLAFHVVVVVVLVLVLVLLPGIIVMVLVVLEEYQSIQSEALFLSEQFWIKPTTMRLNPSFSVARYVVVGATILTNLLLNMATLLRDGSRSFVVTIGGIYVYIYYNIIIYIIIYIYI